MRLCGLRSKHRYEKLFRVWELRRWAGVGSEMIGRQAEVVCEDFITVSASGFVERVLLRGFLVKPEKSYM